MNNVTMLMSRILHCRKDVTKVVNSAHDRPNDWPMEEAEVAVRDQKGQAKGTVPEGVYQVDLSSFSSLTHHRLSGTRHLLLLRLAFVVFFARHSGVGARFFG